jgi:alkylation response protein AidB-like acyl-CoA dehydrogenase
MDLRNSAQDEAFRAEVAAWLADALTGPFADARGLGGPGREHEAVELRQEWEKTLGRAGWTCLGWPEKYGGRGATLQQQVIFYEEYVRAKAPTRVGHIGEGLIGPTLIELGTDAQKARFLPGIVAGEELWCQGYSEPGAGSDLANVMTRARLEDGRWVINGQKVWTSLAHEADWVFVLARSEAGSSRHAGLSYLLVPMHQPGITVRPIVQPTGTSEFNEVFFDDAVTDADCIVGEPGQGWRVAMATLAYERGASTLGQQLSFRQEFDHVLRLAIERGADADPLLRDELVKSWIRLEIMRLSALRTMTSLGAGEPGPEVSIAKLYWSNWHRDFGELAMRVLGEDALVADGEPYELNLPQRLFLFSRSDTIYAGSNEIQRNIIAERTLGLPRSRPRQG